MTFSGHDPSGGAGIQADIEALASHGCHATPVVTSLTVQDSGNVADFMPVSAIDLVAQARAVLEDIPVHAFKTGMTGSSENIAAIHTILQDYPELPLVVDPVLASGGGSRLGAEDAAEALRSLLIPLATVVTPNSLEARALAPGADTLEACAMELLALGAHYVLVTGTHEKSPDVVNTLYDERGVVETFTWDRLPHSYHGSGCTLAAAVAAMLAHGLDPFQAVHEAQEYTWNSLAAGYRPGMGQHFPDRLFWSRQDT